MHCPQVVIRNPRIPTGFRLEAQGLPSPRGYPGIRVIIRHNSNGVASILAQLFTLKGHSPGLSCVAFSPDGQRIVTGSTDKTAKVWEAATAQQVAAWRQEEKAAAGRGD